MNRRRIVTTLATVMLFTAPAQAGSFGFYGSYWQADDADSSGGGGGRIGFQFVKFLELEFHGTYHPSFTTDVAGQALDVEATPVDGGLRVNFVPSGPVNPYLGAGVTYYFLATDQGNIDNKTGIYAQTGLEVGGTGRRFFIEALWRKVDTTIKLASFNRDTRFDGIAANVGVAWRWGQ